MSRLSLKQKSLEEYVNQRTLNSTFQTKYFCRIRFINVQKHFFDTHSYVDFILFKFRLPILDLILLFWIENSRQALPEELLASRITKNRQQESKKLPTSIWSGLFAFKLVAIEFQHNQFDSVQILFETFAIYEILKLYVKTDSVCLDKICAPLAFMMNGSRGKRRDRYLAKRYEYSQYENLQNQHILVSQDSRVSLES